MAWPHARQLTWDCVIRLVHSVRRSSSLGISLGLALIAAVQSSYLVRLTSTELATRGVAIDDAYFYLVIARNFPERGYMTFDGQMPTNGVQPLWQAISIALRYLFPGHDQLAWNIGVSWALYALFVGLLAHFALDRLRLSTTGLLIFSASVPLNPQFQRVAIQGLETPIFLVALVLWMRSLTASSAWLKAPSWRQWMRIALLALSSALLFFTRTDWFVASFATLFVVWSAARSIRHAVGFGGMLALLVGPYLLHNWLIYGHPMPISGRVKLFYLHEFFPNWSAYVASDEWRGMFVLFAQVLHLGSSLTAGIVVLAASALGIITWRHCPSESKPLVLAAAAHAVLMHAVYRELRPYTCYYFCGEVIAAVLLFVFALERVLERPWFKRSVAVGSGGRRWAFMVSAGSAAAFIAVQPAQPPPVSSSWKLRIEIGRALAQFPASAKIAAFWPGAIAYFAQRSVLPLDGIVGSNYYFEKVVKQGREIDYARTHGFEYVVTSFAAPEVVASPKAPELKSWSELGVLRLWESCKYLQGVVLERSDGPRHWRVYALAQKATGWLECVGRS